MQIKQIITLPDNYHTQHHNKLTIIQNIIVTETLLTYQSTRHRRRLWLTCHLTVPCLPTTTDDERLCNSAMVMLHHCYTDYKTTYQPPQYYPPNPYETKEDIPIYRHGHNSSIPTEAQTSTYDQIDENSMSDETLPVTINSNWKTSRTRKNWQQYAQTYQKSVTAEQASLHDHVTHLNK